MHCVRRRHKSRADNSDLPRSTKLSASVGRVDEREGEGAREFASRSPPLWNHIDGFHEHSLPFAPTTMRPLTAIGEVQRWTPLHEPIPPSNTLSPLSPSTPSSCPLFMNQTIGFDLPSVVVEIGAEGGFGPGAHQAMSAVGGEPPLIFTLMTARPVTLFGQSGALSTVNARYVPFAVVYAVGEVFTPANAGMEGFAT